MSEKFGLDWKKYETKRLQAFQIIMSEQYRKNKHGR